MFCFKETRASVYSREDTQKQIRDKDEKKEKTDTVGKGRKQDQQKTEIQKEKSRRKKRKTLSCFCLRSFFSTWAESIKASFDSGLWNQYLELKNITHKHKSKRISPETRQCQCHSLAFIQAVSLSSVTNPNYVDTYPAVNSFFSAAGNVCCCDETDEVAEEFKGADILPVTEIG